MALSICALTYAEAAAAGGGPVISSTVPTQEGILSPDRQDRFLVMPFGKEDTVVARIGVGSGKLEAITSFESRYGEGLGFAQVALDGSSAGISANGRTLVLIDNPAGPINRAQLAVLGTKRLDVRRKIELNGQFTFDAISPDGRNAYVVEYPRPLDYSTYRVRELDLRTGELVPGAIADVDVGEEPEGPMRGLALTRANSEDGRWAYTLYDGGGGVPFIHALDTVEGDAVCIFLEQLQGLVGNRRMNDLTLTLGDAQPALAVAEPESEPLVLVDTATFAISEPVAAAEADGADGGLPYLVVVVGAIGGGLIILLVAAVVRRRRRVAPGAAGPAPASPS